MKHIISGRTNLLALDLRQKVFFETWARELRHPALLTATLDEGGEFSRTPTDTYPNEKILFDVR